MDVEESVVGTFRVYRIGVKIGVLDRRVAADLWSAAFLTYEEWYVSTYQVLNSTVNVRVLKDGEGVYSCVSE
jgi:hypothetical protein